MMINRAKDSSNNKNYIENENKTDYNIDNEILLKSLHLIVKGSGIILTGTLIGSILALFFPIIIARYFSPAEFGIYALAMTVFLFLAQISFLGLDDGCSRNIAFYRGKKDYKKVKDIIVSSFQLIIIFSILISILLFLSADLISQYLLKTNDLSKPLKILSIGIPFSLLIGIIVNIFRGFDSVKENVYFNHILMNGGRLITVIPIILLGLSFDYIFYVYLANIILIFITVIFYFERKIPKEIKIEKSEKSAKKELLIFSIPLLFGSISWFAIQSIDKLMIGFFIGEYDVGVYNVACSISGYLNIFLVSIMFIYQPIGTYLYGAGKNQEIKELYKTITKWTFILASPILMFVFLLPEFSISFLFGSKYSGAAFSLLILFLVYSIRLSLGPAGGSVIMLGKTKQLMYIVASMAIVNIILNWFFIPIYGILGAAIATGLTITILSIFELSYLYKISKIQPIEKIYIKTIFLFISLVIIIHLIFQYTPIPLSIVAKFLIVVFSFLLFILLIFILKLFREEDKLVIRFVKNKIGMKIPLIRRLIR